MGRINMTRVILGGLLAGVVINVSEFVLNGVILQDEMNAQMARLNLPPVSGSAVMVFLALGFLIGIAVVWLYAAIRPRFGPGPKTAVMVAAAVWFLAYVYGTIGMEVTGMLPARMAAIGLTWGLVELVIAAVAGAYVYQEPAAGRQAVSA